MRPPNSPGTFAHVARKNCMLVAVTLAGTLAIVGANAQAPTGQAPSAPKPAGQQFKNIKVLNDIPAEQLFPAMQFIAASLGVECEYCHVRQDHVQGLAFDKDDKKTKVIARKMMQMMFAINKDNFEGKREVTCNTCHRGAAQPIGVPLVAAEELPPGGAEKKPAAAAALPSAEQLFDKYLAASGGAEAIQKVSSRVAKGTLTAFGGQHFPVDIYAKAPDKQLSVMHITGGDSITAFDGHSGWLSVPGRPPHFMTADENAGARIDADLHFPVDTNSLSQKWTVESGEKIDGHDTVLVIGSSEGEARLRLYFETQTGLLARLIRYSETPLGRLPTQIDYSDYREVDGVKLAYRWTLARPGNRFTIQVDELHQNVAVDDAKFTPPPPPAESKPPAH